MTPPPAPHDPRRDYDAVLTHVSAKRRKRRAAGRRSGRRSVLATMVVVLAIGVGVVLSAVFVGGAVWVDDTLNGVSLDTLTADPPGVNTVIYDRDGRRLATFASTENRTPVTSQAISPWLKNATVAIEDRRFYTRSEGVDAQGVMRAFIDNLVAGHITQGGSTIEQQVVRNLYLSNEQSFTRKVREADLAWQLAHEWSKDRILTEYLNIVPYGAITYGCEAAALQYFSVHCKNLNLWQAATLAGIPQNPLVYNPIDNKPASRERRDEVLSAMLSQGMITQQQYDHAVKHPIVVHTSDYLDSSRGGYFVSWVRDLLQKQYGRQTVRKGGLAVTTTLDAALQQDAHRALHDIINWQGAPAAALVAMDPRNGQVLAMDASVPYDKHQQFNLPVAAARQAGSTFKVFTLTAAIAKGIDPDTAQELSGHLSYSVPGAPIGPDNPWEVDTAEISACNCAMTLHQGIIESDNTVFARLAIDIGSDSIAAMAHKLGIPRYINLNTGPAITLGVSPVSPLWMTTAYSTLADNGVRHDPSPILQVSNTNGKLIDKPSDKGRRVIPDGVAYELNSTLQDTVQGTAFRTPLGHGVQAGKTGTTNDYKDAWFCGYTPTLAACVWMGYPQGEISMDTLPVFGHAFGGDYPAEVWTQFMKRAFELRPNKFPAISAWPLPQNPVQFVPFTSQFPTAPPPPTSCDPKTDPTCKSGKGGGGTSGNTGGGSTGGGGGTTGGGGGGSGPPGTT